MHRFCVYYDTLFLPFSPPCSSRSSGSHWHRGFVGAPLPWGEGGEQGGLSRGCKVLPEICRYFWVSGIPGQSLRRRSAACVFCGKIWENGDLRVRHSVSWSQWWKSYWKEPRIKWKPDFLRVTLPANGGRLRSVTGQRFGRILLTLVTQNDVLMQVSRIQTGNPFIGKSPNEVTGKQPCWPKACRLFP